MNFFSTTNPEVLIIEPDLYRDARGFFFESYQKTRYSDAGIKQEFVQDNHSSSQKFTLRGLHYQVTHTQGKLVRVVVGEIFDVAVDLRQRSSFFGRWVGVNLSAENNRQLWIPPGFAHGFLVLSDSAEVVYKATDYYDPLGERCIRWDDPELAIDWPIDAGVTPLVSRKDAQGINFWKAEVFE